MMMIVLIIKSRQQLIFGIGKFESLFIVGEVRISNLLYNQKKLYQLSYNWNPRYSRRLKSPFVLFLKQLNSNLYEQQSDQDHKERKKAGKILHVKAHQDVVYYQHCLLHTVSNN